LQRRLSIGYQSSQNLDQLEEVGAVGRAEGSSRETFSFRDAEEFIINLQ